MVTVNEFMVLAENLKKRSFEDLIKKYKTDYLVWDKNRDQDWKINEQNFLQLLFELDSVAIYKIN